MDQHHGLPLPDYPGTENFITLGHTEVDTDTDEDGGKRVNMMKFLNALIEAEGIQLDSVSDGNGRGGRSASFRITVQSNGNLLIGSTYTKQMGLEPGDEFEISLGRKHIRLRQLNVDDDEDFEED